VIPTGDSFFSEFLHIPVILFDKIQNEGITIDYFVPTNKSIIFSKSSLYISKIVKSILDLKNQGRGYF
jgi:ribosomal protein S2